MDIQSFFSIIQTIIVLIIVILIANLVLKYLNKYISGKNKAIKIVERVAVNKNSYISIVEICGKYYLMSFNENNNQILKELDGEEIEGLLIEEIGNERDYYLEMGKKIGKKIFNRRNNNNYSDDINSTNNIC
ncbi:MAG: flagellar biosynthetic protein FliO [Tissierellaceae bacterium]|nr:flagellar biosynthetic protein FliO [Tissierellaceae bacterium]